MSASAAWTSSHLASTLLRNGSLAWKAGTRAKRGAARRQSLKNVAPEAFAARARRRDRRRAPTRCCAASSVIAIIPIAAPMPSRRCCGNRARRGCSITGPAGGAPVLVVPSLINRAYVLDLLPEASLLRHLVGAPALRPLLLDWGAPGEAERGFGLDDYIAGRLEDAAAAAAEATGARARGARLLHGRAPGGGAGAAPARSGVGVGVAGDAVGFPCRAREQARLLGAARGAAGREFRRARRSAGRCAADVFPRQRSADGGCANSPASPRWRRAATPSAASSRSRTGSMTACRWRSAVARGMLGRWYGENRPGARASGASTAGRSCPRKSRRRASSWCRARTASCRRSPPPRWPII